MFPDTTSNALEQSQHKSTMNRINLLGPYVTVHVQITDMTMQLLSKHMLDILHYKMRQKFRADNLHFGGIN